MRVLHFKIQLGIEQETVAMKEKSRELEKDLEKRKKKLG